MKIKKLFIFLTLLLSVFTLFACSNKTKFQDQRKLKMHYFKNKFPNIADLVQEQEQNNITNLDVKDLKDYKQASLYNDFLYQKKLTDEENTYSFYNLKEKTECKIKINEADEKLETQYRPSSNIIVIRNNKDKKYNVYSQKDGALLKTFEYETRSDLVFNYDYIKYDKKSIDKITYFDAVKKTTTVYYVYEYKLTNSVDDIKKDTYNINEKEELVIQQQSLYYALYYQNKLYDEIREPLNTTAYYLLENNNILFKSFVEFNKDLIGDDFDHIKKIVEVSPGRFEVKTYILKYYLYNFKTKKLNEIKLPYLIYSLTSNRKNNDGKLPFSNKAITNVAQVSFINPKNKELEKSTYSFVIDNDFNKHQFIEGIDDFNLIKLNNNKVLKSVATTYYLLNEKGQTEFIFNENYKVINLIQNRYLVCGDTDISSEKTIYDLNSFDSNNKTFKQMKAYSLTEDSQEYLFKNENNEILKLENGELKKLSGKFYSIYNKNLLVCKDEEKFYMYNLKGDELTSLNTSAIVFNKAQSKFLYLNDHKKLHIFRFNYLKDAEPVELLITLITTK